jgi:plastocyanin
MGRFYSGSYGLRLSGSPDLRAAPGQQDGLKPKGVASMKASLTLLAVAASAAAFAGQAAASSNIGITIRHQLVGCHSWAVGNGAYKPTQMVTIKAGSSLTFTDNDVMSHTIVQLTGPRLTLIGARLGKMGAHTRIVLRKPGTYVFGTKAGEDYTKGVVTKGEDNVLRLVVTVKP